MFGFGGISELMFIFFLAMLIFGPEKLPEIGRMLAKGMAEVRKASNELKRTLNAELAVSEQEIEARKRAAAAPPIALAPMPPMAPMAPLVPEAPFTSPAAEPWGGPEAASAPSAWGFPAPPETPAGGATEAAAVPSTWGFPAPAAASAGGAADDAVAHEATAPAPEAWEAPIQSYGEGHEPLDDRSDIVPEPR